MYNIYIGGYTKKENKGVKLVTFDGTRLSEPRLVLEAVSPTYVSLTFDQAQLITHSMKDKNGVVLVAKLLPTGDLFTLASAADGSGNSCYVGMDTSETFVVNACYSAGVVEARRVVKDFAGLWAKQDVRLVTDNKNARQNAAHPHIACANDDCIFVCDLGADRVYTFMLGADRFVYRNSIKLLEGTGPRHIVFNKNNYFAYVVGELANTITVLAYGDDNSFTYVGTYTTLRQDFEGENTASAIKLSPDNRFLYCANRGEDTIIVYRLDANGSVLSLVGSYDTMGQGPRDFAITADGRFVIVPHEVSGDLVVFERNQETGELSYLTQSQTLLPEATGIAVTSWR